MIPVYEAGRPTSGASRTSSTSGWLVTTAFSGSTTRCAKKERRSSRPTCSTTFAAPRSSRPGAMG
ncbi:MAG: hypothetical protein R3F20_07555 [Planctomycetota bacterium]